MSSMKETRGAESPATQRPTIGLCTDRIEHWRHASHNVPQTYVEAVIAAAGGLPVLLPSGNPALDQMAFLAVVDGLLFTGSPSNVEPACYDGLPDAPGTLHDPLRDATTLPLIRAAVALGVPVLAICRGFQEMNVAFGGSLHQAVHTLPGALNHPAGIDRPRADWYAPSHDVSLEEDGWLRAWIGCPTVRVNSLHQQGVDRLGEGLHVEAVAPDGLIEAFREIGRASCRERV